MKSNIQIAHGGGWVTRQTIGRPKVRFFGVLSVIWLVFRFARHCHFAQAGHSHSDIWIGYVGD